MTWGEFKQWAEEKGVKDTDEIEWINFEVDPHYDPEFTSPPEGVTEDIA